MGIFDKFYEYIILVFCFLVKFCYSEVWIFFRCWVFGMGVQEVVVLVVVCGDWF